MAKFDAYKFHKAIERAAKQAGDDFVSSISRSDKQDIGDAAVVKMQELIAKGISPIGENGRFPAYKWAGRANLVAKIGKSLPLKSLRKKARALAQDMKKNRYPYSAQKKFPDKRERPVNLYLSGKMLDNLQARITTKGVEVGYFDRASALKEQGHRDGVNGQPRRPTIPQPGEQFASSVYLAIVAAVKRIIGQRTK